jgi:hypothetical protein
MTQVVPDASFIDLGVVGAEDRTRGGPQLPVHLRRPLLAAGLALVCLLALAASVRGRPGLGDPLWTGSVSLNGFTLGTRSLYVARPDGKAVTALDLLTGRPRWSRDITELPNSTYDLGNGVAVVMTSSPSSDGFGPHEATITLVRDGTGERIAQIAGSYYLPSADGHLLLVFSTRSRDPDSCAASETRCEDVTAWDMGTGAVAWRLNLAPNTGSIPSIVDGRVEALAEFHADRTVRLHDVSTGAVTGTMSLSPEVFHSGGVGMVRDMFLTAQRGPEGITVTAYRRPSLGRSWSVVVSDFTPMSGEGDGRLILSECGPDACMTVSGGSTRVIGLSTGSVRPPIAFEVIQRLGGGVFLANRIHPEVPLSLGMGARMAGFVVDLDGRTLATLAVVGLVEWSDSGDRGLATQEGPDRTGFLVIDDRGGVRSLGSVPGTGLTCRARADVLACSDPGGTLRVWRLPLSGF